MSTQLSRNSTPGLLARLIASPELARTVQALPEQTFSSLIRKIGVEDAGELIALASTRQLVAAFDEDLFVAPRSGERQVMDVERLVAWLYAICEAGEEAAAERIVELSESFVADAFSRIILVLDNDDLLQRLSEGDEASRFADKALESARCEEFDHYLLVSRFHDGWDAVYPLILALDARHQNFLSRILERCAAVSRATVDDLDLLCSALSEADSLAEDVEAEREERRARQGYVEARAARAFLTLARQATGNVSATQIQRDPITRMHFRDLASGQDSSMPPMTGDRTDLLALLDSNPAVPCLPSGDEPAPPSFFTMLTEAMQQLETRAPGRFGELMRELAYLANVIIAGAPGQPIRIEAHEAAEAALATVALGVYLECSRGKVPTKNLSHAQLRQVLADCTADRLFRQASSQLALTQPESQRAFLGSRFELAEHVDPRDESFS